MKCVSCLSNIDEEDNICPYCGHKLIEKQTGNLELQSQNLNAHTLLKYGMESHHSDPQKAMEFLTMALQRESDLAEAHNGLGFLYLNQNQLEQAETYFHQALSLKPKEALFHYNLACLYLRKEIHEQALFHVQKSLELKPDFELAQQLEQHCQTLTPEFLSRYRNGEDLVKQHQSDQAITHFNELLVEYPSHAPSQALLGQAYAMSGQFTEAIEWLEKSIALENDPKNCHQLSMMYIHNSQPEKALEILELAIQQRPEYSDFHFSRGIAYENMGEYERSLDGFETALAFNPGNTKVFFKMALLHEKHNQLPAAIEALEQLLEIEPESPLARAKLLQLKVS